ncbi:hypothetical protein M378DRAFT_59006, partial [Amanita muscaria Koide BX008]
LSEETKAKLQKQWKHRKYLIIDEYSMIAKTFLAALSRNISIAKEAEDSRPSDHSFGAESLFSPLNTATDSLECQLGRKIYEEFSTVVILKEQMRVTDTTWGDLLDHLRHGRMQEKHIQILRQLIISKPEASVDFSRDPWSNAALVTPRHAVRRLWNEVAARQWCASTGDRLYVCTAEDTIGGRQLSWPERYAVASRGNNDRKRKSKDLPWKIEIAKGMKILVTDNVETDLDVTNGARGVIEDIILHPDEPAIGDSPLVNLKYLPAYILVKLCRTRA